MNLNYGYKKYNITFTGSFMHAHLPSQQSDTAQRKRMVSYRKKRYIIHNAYCDSERFRRITEVY